MAKISLITVTVMAINFLGLAMATFYVPEQEWSAYKALYQKDYTSAAFSEANARFYYGYNKKMINKHNALYDRGFKTFKLAINQFTDMRFIHFNDLFPQATFSAVSYDRPPPEVNIVPDAYDPRINEGLLINVEDQGTKCNSGWAYAVAKSVELFAPLRLGNINPESLSAQNLIDCAGRSKACINQVPQAAFDYLTQYGMGLHFESDYRNINNQSVAGMCTPPNGAQQPEVKKIGAYSKIINGDDESVKKYVSVGMPVVVEFNPTSFEFMHYSEGIFQQPNTRKGSHFMAVIGYGQDTNKTNMNYWTLQNSFGTSWGEQGFLRVHRTPKAKIAKNSLFPSELGP